MKRYSSVFGRIIDLRDLLNNEIDGFSCIVCINGGTVGLAISNKGGYDHREICHIIDALALKRINEIRQEYPQFYIRYIKSSFSRFL